MDSSPVHSFICGPSYTQVLLCSGVQLCCQYSYADRALLWKHRRKYFWLWTLLSWIIFRKHYLSAYIDTSFSCIPRLLHQLEHVISSTMQQHSYSSRPWSFRCDISNPAASSQVFFSKKSSNNNVNKGYNTTWCSSSSLLSIQLTKK